MQKFVKLYLLLCCCLLSASCTRQPYYVNADAIQDFKGEAAPGQFCINPSHPYAVVGPKPLPPLSQVPRVIGKPLPIHQL